MLLNHGFAQHNLTASYFQTCNTLYIGRIEIMDMVELLFIVKNILSIVHIDLPNDFPTIECVVLDVLQFRDCRYHFICLYNSHS